MSGWALVMCPRPDALERWGAAVRALVGQETITSRAGEGWLLLAWRRDRGEFPHSGTIHPTPDGGHLAWLGQTLGDSGETTRDSIRALASGASDGALASINGPFAAAIARGSAATIITDRYRHYPVYTHSSTDLFIAATDIRLVALLLEHPHIDRDALDLLLRSGELIDGQSLLKGVELLPPATILSASADGIRQRRYWRMRHAGRPDACFDDLANTIAGHLRTAVRRIQSASPRLAITLSGGLDSRFILGLCNDPSSVPSFTWGDPGCRDIQCAADFARRVGSPHTIRHWEPHAFPPLWPLGSALTAGSFGVESMYMLPYVPLLQRHADVILNGLAGDAFLGGNFLKLSWLREQSLADLAAATWRWRVSESQDAAVDRLTGRRGPGRDAWIASIARETSARPIERLNDWLYENRVFRNTNSGTMLLRSGVESHAPFFDNDVADTLLTIPQEMKFKHRLYLAVLNRACPAAAAVKWQRTFMPPAWGFLPNTASMAFHRVVTAAGKRLGLHPFPHLPVADPAAWLRQQWRQDAHDILFDQRTLSRGLVAPDALRQLWEEHQAGGNHTRHLGVLIAVEVFCRQILDRAPLESPRADPVGALAP